MKGENTYKSAKVLLDIAEKQYSGERQRTDSIDGKAGMFVGFILAIFAFIFPYIPYKEIKTKFMTGKCIEQCILIIILIILALSSFFMLVALYNLFKGFSLKPFSQFEATSISDSELLHQDANVTEKTLTEKYCEAADDNKKTNDNKADYVAKGLKCSINAFLTVLMSFLILNFWVL